ncbi:MAG: hypothetical protein EXX96DRAFT_582969 [Benjaminiella poitrasii]|nr:MAG: hypothetical protein EXX96DRAFT_582969 [Benjaminiella poitrasii]
MKQRQKQPIVFIPLPDEDPEIALKLIRNNNNRLNTIQSQLFNNVYPRRFYNYKNDSLRYIGEEIIKQDITEKPKKTKDLIVAPPKGISSKTLTTSNDKLSQPHQYYERQKQINLAYFKKDDSRLPPIERSKIGNEGRPLTKREEGRMMKNWCQKCNRVFKNYYYHHKHMIYAHDEEAERSRSKDQVTVKCKKCKRSFTSAISLQWHTNVQHPIQRKYRKRKHKVLKRTDKI